MDRELLAALGDVEQGAEGDALVVDVDGRLLVGDLVAVDGGAVSRPQVDLAVGLEARRSGDADQQNGDPGVHDVAAVAAPVASRDGEDRARNRPPGQSPPRCPAAPQLLGDDDEDSYFE